MSSNNNGVIKKTNNINASTVSINRNINNNINNSSKKVIEKISNNNSTTSVGSNYTGKNTKTTKTRCVSIRD